MVAKLALSCVLQTVAFMSVTSFVAAQSSFYFATNQAYVNSTLDAPPFFTVTFAGSLATVSQQCRRNCAFNPDCQAFQVQLLQILPAPGMVQCLYFASNACNWSTISLVHGLTPSSVLWDKLFLTGSKVKPCVEYCAVKYRGNCTQCRGNSVFKGLECDIPPKLCSDYPLPVLGLYPIWPRGIDGPQLMAYCLETWMIFFMFSRKSDGLLNMGYFGASGFAMNPETDSSANFTAWLEALDWTSLSELVAQAGQKELMLVVDDSTSLNFTGFELSPAGDLTLSAPIGYSIGFPTPLDQVPFVHDSSCNAYFWQFESDVPVCSQPISIQFSGLVWNGAVLSDTSIVIAFR